VVVSDHTASDSDRGLRYRAWLEGVVGVPATDGNHVEILRNGDQIFPAMLEAIRASCVSVDFVTFIFDGAIAQEFADALSERAEAGLRVRVLLDAIGAAPCDRRILRQMKGAGVKLALFRPLANGRVWETFHRVHRKVLVCDQKVAFTGGVGVADRWRGDARGPSEWRDNHFRIQGPAVDGLIGTFVHNWAETGADFFDEEIDRFLPQPADGKTALQVVRTGARTGWGEMSTLAWTLLRLAQSRVRIAAAYFVPDDHMLAALCSTAKRGVDVELLLNGESADKRLSRLATEAQYDMLLEAGVKIWSFDPTMLHVKATIVDGLVASVGSANFNSRSMLLDEEVNVVIFDSDLVASLEALFEDDVGRAQLVEPQRWAARPRGRKALESLPGFLARHL
jgi:cardiolipin synthase